MSASERRQRLLAVLCLRRHDTYDNLAREFHVCKRTIRYDVAALMCAYPIETVCGRYGGVKVASWYHPRFQNLACKKLTPKEVVLLRKLRIQLIGDDLDTMDSILAKFAP